MRSRSSLYGLTTYNQGMAHCNLVKMPLDPNIKIEPNPDGNERDRSNSSAQLLGELQYVANATRPDIAFAVNRLASYTANPSLQHTNAIKRILIALLLLWDIPTLPMLIARIENPRQDTFILLLVELLPGSQPNRVLRHSLALKPNTSPSGRRGRKLPGSETYIMS